ncbi:MAG: DUF1501 domain-containing protein [Planctomycetales bacterium]|nr:DUF1501 domain-containing protein [Planctomycetales bacterium]
MSNHHESNLPSLRGIGPSRGTRRAWLQQAASGFGWLAAASLLNQATRLGKADDADGLPAPHHPATAKQVIFCYMSGGVSQVDSFDPKPALKQLHGQPIPFAAARTQFNNNGTMMASPWGFRPYGESGIEVSDLFPKLGQCVDKMAIVRSMTAKFSEHAQGNFFMHTGFPFLGHPSAGAWINYGLGSMTDELPGFCVLGSGDSTVPHGGVSLFSSGFLPANHQASLLTVDRDEPLRNVRPRELDQVQQGRLRFLEQADREFARQVTDTDPIEAAIRNYEMAYRMQTAVPDLVDLSDETQATREMYGLEDPEPKTAAYGRQCLLARRLIERGVRFVELSCLAYNLGGGNGANPWDHHGALQEGHGKMAHQVDQPLAALLTDLEQRGLLESTLVVWAGEFGRTPFSQGSDGRDHDPFGFSIWMAGGGVKGGTVYGATDELGYQAVEDPCDVYDLWATVLHALGLDHERLTYRHAGRDFRLTDVHGRVLKQVLGS